MEPNNTDSLANIVFPTFLLVPAVYYAHLASARARSHEDVPASSGPQSGPGVKQGQVRQGPRESDTPQLLPMPNNDRIGFKVWYI